MATTGQHGEPRKGHVLRRRVRAGFGAIAALIALGLLLIPGSAAAAGATWQQQPVAPAGAPVSDWYAPGWYSSLVVDGLGVPHVAYRGIPSNPNSIMYAYYDGTTWRGEASATAPDNVSALVGLPSTSTGYVMSLALDSHGYPHIAFATGDRSLRYASWTGSAWTVETVQQTTSGSWTGMYPSLVIDSTDTPHISYINCLAGDSRNCTNGGTLMYATKTGGSWTTTEVDATGNVNRQTSLALDSGGRPHIGYFDQSTSTLKYASFSGTWDITSVTMPSGVTAASGAMALHDDLPRFAYVTTGGSLRYASWNGSSWVTSAAGPSSLDTGYTGIIALAVDNDDVAHIAYARTTANRPLNSSTYSNGTWQSQSISQSGSIGDWYPSLALNAAGEPRVTYFKRVTASTGPLMFAAEVPSSSAFTISKQQRLLIGSGAVEENPNDQLTVQKQEQFVGLSPGQTQTATVACPAGYVVLDGSPLIQHVDQGAGSPADIEVLQSQSSGTGGYTFKLHNPTGGNAQAKVFITCVKQSTYDGGTISVSGAVSATTAFSTGTTLRTLSCPAGSVAVDPGYRFTDGYGIVTRSQPSADLASWTFAINSGGDGTADLSIRCLSPRTSDGHLLVTQELTNQVTVPAGQTVSVQLNCPVGYKGIVASYVLPAGLQLLGDEPQPITRVFSLQNTTSGPLTATLDLLCLRNTTGHSSSVFTTAPLAATVGQTVEYRILVTNTGQVPLTFSNFSDPNCDPDTLAGGPGSTPLPPGESATYTCKRALDSAGSYSNRATVTGTPAGGTAITHSSNLVLVSVTAPAPAFSALTIAPSQHGANVLVGLTVSKRNTRVHVDVYGLVAQLSSKSATAAGRFMPIGRALRTSANGHVNITIRLNAQARRALNRRHHLKVTVIVRVTPPRGAGHVSTRRATRVVMLRS